MFLVCLFYNNLVNAFYFYKYLYTLSFMTAIALHESVLSCTVIVLHHICPFVRLSFITLVLHCDYHSGLSFVLHVYCLSVGFKATCSYNPYWVNFIFKVQNSIYIYSLPLSKEAINWDFLLRNETVNKTCK